MQEFEVKKRINFNSVELLIYFPKEDGFIEVSVETKSEELVLHALSMNATDIHVIPKRRFAIIQARVDQRLFTLEEMPLKQSERLISHFKYLAGMDIGERRKPQNASIHHYLPVNGNIHLRLSTLPSAYNEALAIRFFTSK
ncbi:ATPase, T2SS/T4P/T4SS family [Pseudalkalibacillus sp. A8]|uniref:ATPase, T2SS/T4P/T4SS family n=1 Tax=Pseudalkalibacillus sp. A8 TaxID=3382641 RepID=UPI0038B48A2A